MPEESNNSAGHAGAGHRARLRDRLLTGGPEALADYELLEFLLFAAIRQGDTKPLAKNLIAQFGSFAAVLAADPQALKQVKGMGLGKGKGGAKDGLGKGVGVADSE